jgi:hypothetical protein
MHRQNQTGRLPTGRGFTISWPRKILGPCPGLKELNLLCWSLFVILLILPLSVFLYLNLRTASGSLRSLHSDFVYFYGIGQIANAYPAIRIYDPALQLQTFSRIYALTNGTYGPSPYPPFVALFLSLFARLPFDAAYILWAALSLTMYIVGISATVKAVLPPQRFLTSLTLCLALAFGPFLFGTLLNGQLAAVAVFSIGIALSNEARSKPFASGVALSLLAYKPTLLLLLLPMLLLTRRYKTLFGFLTGASALLLLTTAFAGIKIWPAYVHFLDYFSRTVGVGGHSALQLWQFVDLNSLSFAIPGGRSKTGLLILIAAIIAIAAYLAILLRKSSKAGEAAQHMAWAVMLTCTLLLNVYVPIYDSVLIVIVLVLTLASLGDPRWIVIRGWIIFLSVLILAVSWITEAFARRHGIQLLSIFLAVLGAAQLFLLRQLLLKEI